MQLLVERIKKHDRKAQEILYKKYADRFFYLCFRYSGNETNAAEILNNAFYKIFENIGLFHFINEKAFEGWMYKIVINEALLFLRQSKYYNTKVEIENSDLCNASFEESYLTEEDCMHVLQKLPSGYRTVFNLYAIEGYSHQEISEMLEITESTSRSQLSRAREILKSLIKKEI
jgi:RNA polymerase sigma factor (sigma-70 family)